MKSAYFKRLHTIALITAIATFPLIFMGGLVTSHGAGMSVPDWPNSYGYNLFTFPISLWKGGIYFEHTHRLMGSVVGICSIVLMIAAWTLESRRWVQWLATAVLGAVIFQGVLGGLRVVFVNLDLAIVHACFAQAFFCLATLVAIVTSKWWMDVDREQTIHVSKSDRHLISLAAICTCIIYAQLIIGAVMRHEQAGLAIPDLPLAYGKLLPPISSDGLAAINALRVGRLNLPAVTLAQVWLHFAHRVGALVVSAAVITLIAVILKLRDRSPSLRRPAIILLLLLLAQLTLGVLTVYLRKPADIASMHVACGALVLVTSFTIFVRSARLYFAASEATLPRNQAGARVGFNAELAATL